MRSNVTLIVLVVMLGGLAAGVALRGRDAHEAPAIASASPSAEAAPSTSSAASALPTGSSSAAPADTGPTLKRPLRVVSLGWELVAAGVMVNDGASPGKDSAFSKAKVEVHLAGKSDIAAVENALARGGKDEEGADIAIMELPRFVASYERLKALNPIIFFVAGWSEGREVVMSKKKSFADLPPRDAVKLQCETGSAAAFVGLYALMLSGTSPDRVEMGDENADWMALPRRKAKAASEQAKANLLLSTAEASRLVPIVAVAQASMLEKHRDVLEIWGKLWLEGHGKVAADASEAARKIAEAKGAPEPLEVLSNLGEFAPASLAENASATGLSGRGAVTVESLFRRSWDIWRQAKVLSIPPESAPVDGRIIAALVRAGGALEVPVASRKSEKPDTAGKPLIVHRVPAALDADALVEEVGFIAGVFRRSPIKLTVHPRGGLDVKRTEEIVKRAIEQFGLPADRLVVGKAASVANAQATVEVMPVP